MRAYNPRARYAEACGRAPKVNANGMEAAFDLRRARIASALWLVLWSAIAGWSAYTLATAWPYVHLLPQWPLLIAAAGIAFRAFDLACMHALRRRVQGWRRFLARVLALLAGVPAGTALWQPLDALAMARFERALVPLIDQVHANAVAPCPPAAHYPIGAEFAAYQTASKAPQAAAALYHDARRFVVALGGRSADIDGSTLFYDSRTRTWRKVHNDALNRTGELDTLTAGLTACRIPLR